MYNNTNTALRLIFNGEYDPKNPIASLQHVTLKNQFVIAEKNDTIIYQRDTMKYFYFLLKGRACVLNHISWNSDNIIDYLEPLDILGLIEFLNHTTSYTAFVTAETKCILYRVPLKEFIQIIQEDVFLCFHTLLVLGKVTESNMNRAETSSLFHQKDILGHYLYLQAHHETPYVCPLTRAVLSEELHINLRTLYRHINYLEKSGYLILKKGKIVIEAQHLAKLSHRYGDVIL